jgi:hypothetical protein
MKRQKSDFYRDLRDLRDRRGTKEYNRDEIRFTDRAVLAARGATRASA